MAVELIPRWQLKDSKPLNLDESAPAKAFTADDIAAGNDTFSVIAADASAANWNGIYLVLQPLSVKCTYTDFSQLSTLLTTNFAVKLTDPQPVTYTQALKGTCKAWVAYTKYMTGDAVFINGTTNQKYVVWYKSVINNNIQGVFKPNWEIATGTSSVRGLFTIPMGLEGQLKNDLPTKIRGAPYFAFDTHTLWVFDGQKWEQLRGLKIDEYDPALEDSYLLGQVVSGKLTGRMEDSGNVFETYGIWRRDPSSVLAYTPFDCKLLTGNREEIHVMPGHYFYIKDFTTDRNGIYQAQELIALVIDTSQVNPFLELDRDLQQGIVTKVTNPGATISDHIAIPFQGNYNYLQGDRFYIGTDFSKVYEIPVNLRSDATFDPTKKVEGWTCVADLSDTLHWEEGRRDAYIQVGIKDDPIDGFPAIGIINTLYVDIVTGRIYIWNGAEYILHSEEYPYVETLGISSPEDNKVNIGYTNVWAEEEKTHHDVYISSVDPDRLPITFTPTPNSPTEPNRHYRGEVASAVAMAAIFDPVSDDFCYRSDKSQQFLYDGTVWNPITYILPTTLPLQHDLKLNLNTVRHYDFTVDANQYLKSLSIDLIINDDGLTKPTIWDFRYNLDFGSAQLSGYNFTFTANTTDDDPQALDGLYFPIELVSPVYRTGVANADVGFEHQGGGAFQVKMDVFRLNDVRLTGELGFTIQEGIEAKFLEDGNSVVISDRLPSDTKQIVLSLDHEQAGTGEAPTYDLTSPVFPLNINVSATETIKREANWYKATAPFTLTSVNATALAADIIVLRTGSQADFTFDSDDELNYPVSVTWNVNQLAEVKPYQEWLRAVSAGSLVAIDRWDLITKIDKAIDDGVLTRFTPVPQALETYTPVTDYSVELHKRTSFPFSSANPNYEDVTTTITTDGQVVVEVKDTNEIHFSVPKLQYKEL
jgi:hypothetical protein